jgi:hypothetical protein
VTGATVTASVSRTRCSLPEVGEFAPQFMSRDAHRARLADVDGCPDGRPGSPGGGLPAAWVRPGVGTGRGVRLVLVPVAHLVPEPLQLGVGLLPVFGSQREKSPRDPLFRHAEMTPALIRVIAAMRRRLAGSSAGCSRLCRSRACCPARVRARGAGRRARLRLRRPPKLTQNGPRCTPNRIAPPPMAGPV